MRASEIQPNGDGVGGAATLTESRNVPRPGTYSNAHLIFNPYAGKLQRNPGLLKRTLRHLADQGLNVTETPTTGPQVAGKLARESIESGADLIIAAGGDGTINEVMNGMVHSHVPLAILPLGTANVLACELGMSKNMERAAAHLAESRREVISLGRLAFPDGSERYFMMMAGIGLDAEVVYNVNAALKARIGKVAYWLSGFRHLGARLPEFDAIVGEESFRSSFALGSRVRNYGGDLTICRNASLLASDLELVMFHGSSSWLYLKYFMGVLTGRIYAMEGVTVKRAKELELRHADDPRIYIQVDGEYAGKLPVRISIVPDALTLLVPAKFKR